MCIYQVVFGKIRIEIDLYIMNKLSTFRVHFNSVKPSQRKRILRVSFTQYTIDTNIVSSRSKKIFYITSTLELVLVTETTLNIRQRNIFSIKSKWWTVRYCKSLLSPSYSAKNIKSVNEKWTKLQSHSSRKCLIFNPNSFVAIRVTFVSGSVLESLACLKIILASSPFTKVRVKRNSCTV